MAASGESLPIIRTTPAGSSVRQEIPCARAICSAVRALSSARSSPQIPAYGRPMPQELLSGHPAANIFAIRENLSSAAGSSPRASRITSSPSSTAAQTWTPACRKQRTASCIRRRFSDAAASMCRRRIMCGCSGFMSSSRAVCRAALSESGALSSWARHSASLRSCSAGICRRAISWDTALARSENLACAGSAISGRDSRSAASTSPAGITSGRYLPALMQTPDSPQRSAVGSRASTAC